MAKRVHRLRVSSSENYILVENKLIKINKVPVMFARTTKPYINIFSRLTLLKTEEEIRAAITKGFEIIWK